MIIGLILFILILAAVLISLYENTHFVVSSYTINDERFKNNNIRAVFISDLHDNHYGTNNEKLIKSIKEISPDFILLGGDIFNGIKNKKNKYADKLLIELSKSFKLIYAIGNHEYRYYLYPEEFPGEKKRLEDLLSKNNITLLDNKKTTVVVNGTSIDIYGLTIDKKFYKRISQVDMNGDYVTDIFEKKDDSAFSILMAHNPQYFESYCGFDPELVLSGHYHGGIMRIGRHGIVSPSYRLFPKYSYGLFNKNNTKLIVTSGLGVHTIRFRIFNRPELVLIEFKG